MVIDTERFEVERVVGSGSMGTVFRARDRDSNQPVALKIIRSENPTRAARFDREAEVLEMLEHPSIVRYIGHGVTRAGERFLVMEWLDGETLKARIVREGLSLGETLSVGLRIAGGLAAAHRAGVVHRDVKPTNMVLVGGGVDGIKLIDFGVAAWRRPDGDALTETGDVIGTPAYMAPEQAHGRKVGPPADVFGLGCVLYECISGRAPFIHSRYLAPLSTTANTAAAPALRSLRPEVPAPVAELVERMIARDPGARPGDGGAALAELEALAGLDVSGIGPPVRARRAAPAEATAAPAALQGSSSDGFARLRRDHQSAPELSPTATRILAVLARHVPMPLAVLRSQCERVGKDPQVLEVADLVLVAPALADAVARFTKPTLRALVLGELTALAAGKAD